MQAVLSWWPALPVLIAIASCSRDPARVNDRASFECAATDSAWSEQGDSSWGLIRWYNDAGMDWKLGTPQEGYGGGAQVAFAMRAGHRIDGALYMPLDKGGSHQEPDTFVVTWRAARTTVRRNTLVRASDGQWHLTDIDMVARPFVLRPRHEHTAAPLDSALYGPFRIDSFVGVFRCDSVVGTSWSRRRAHAESLAFTRLPF